MRESIDDYVSALATPQRVVALRLQDLLGEELPQATAAMWHDHPAWLIGGLPIAGFRAYPDHVTLIFSAGKRISDPSGRLQASSGPSETASVKFAHVEEVDDDLVRGWMRQAAALAST
jgi:hypothetical protein